MANKTGRSTVTGGANRRLAKGVTPLAGRSSFSWRGFCRRGASEGSKTRKQAAAERCDRKP